MFAENSKLELWKKGQWDEENSRLHWKKAKANSHCMSRGKGDEYDPNTYGTPSPTRLPRKNKRVFNKWTWKYDLAGIVVEN